MCECCEPIRLPKEQAVQKKEQGQVKEQGPKREPATVR